MPTNKSFSERYEDRHREGSDKYTIDKSYVVCLADKMGVDPFRILLMIAAGDYKGLGYDSPTIEIVDKNGITRETERIPIAIRSTAARDVAKYMRPQLKSIEVKAEIENTQVTESFEQYLERIKLEANSQANIIQVVNKDGSKA